MTPPLPYHPRGNRSMRRSALLALAAALLAFIHSGASSSPPGKDQKDGGKPDARGPKQKIIGYFAEWSVYGRKFNVGDIPAAKLTHVNYAFAKINDKGECAL